MVKKIIHLIAICVMLTACKSCNFGYDKDLLTYRNKFVFDNQFRMDGIYLNRREDITGYSMKYFFQDGYLYKAFEETEGIPECYEVPYGSGESPVFWGCFIVEDNILKTQYFFPSGGTLDFECYEKWAEIVNDTTLHFFKRFCYNCPYGRDKEKDIDETFHFKQCDNKPDSTNVLMSW